MAVITESLGTALQLPEWYTGDELDSDTIPQVAVPAMRKPRLTEESMEVQWSLIDAVIERCKWIKGYSDWVPDGTPCYNKNTNPYYADREFPRLCECSQESDQREPMASYSGSSVTVQSFLTDNYQYPTNWYTRTDSDSSRAFCPRFLKAHSRPSYPLFRLTHSMGPRIAYGVDGGSADTRYHMGLLSDYLELALEPPEGQLTWITSEWTDYTNFLKDTEPEGQREKCPMFGNLEYDDWFYPEYPYEGKSVTELRHYARPTAIENALRWIADDCCHDQDLIDRWDKFFNGSGFSDSFVPGWKHFSCNLDFPALIFDRDSITTSDDMPQEEKAFLSHWNCGSSAKLCMEYTTLLAKVLSLVRFSSYEDYPLSDFSYNLGYYNYSNVATWDCRIAYERDEDDYVSATNIEFTSEAAQDPKVEFDDGYDGGSVAYAILGSPNYPDVEAMGSTGSTDEISAFIEDSSARADLFQRMILKMPQPEEGSSYTFDIAVSVSGTNVIVTLSGGGYTDSETFRFGLSGSGEMSGRVLLQKTATIEATEGPKLDPESARTREKYRGFVINRFSGGACRLAEQVQRAVRRAEFQVKMVFDSIPSGTAETWKDTGGTSSRVSTEYRDASDGAELEGYSEIKAAAESQMRGDGEECLKGALSEVGIDDPGTKAAAKKMVGLDDTSIANAKNALLRNVRNIRVNRTITLAGDVEQDGAVHGTITVSADRSSTSVSGIKITNFECGKMTWSDFHGDFGVGYVIDSFYGSCTYTPYTDDDPKPRAAAIYTYPVWLWRFDFQNMKESE